MCVCVRRFLWAQSYSSCVVAWGKEGGLRNCFIHQLTLLSVGISLSWRSYPSHSAGNCRIEMCQLSRLQSQEWKLPNPAVKQKTNQTNCSTLNSAERWLYECVCTSLNVSTLFGSTGLMANTESGNVDATLGLITASKQTVGQDHFLYAMSGLQVVADSALLSSRILSFR
jgi:hypothetical protein